MRLITSLKEEKLELDKYVLIGWLFYPSNVSISVRHLVLDEADRMLDAEFLPQIQEIVESCTHPTLQKVIFSATLPAGAEQVAMSMLKNPIRVVVGLKQVIVSLQEVVTH